MTDEMVVSRELERKTGSELAGLVDLRKTVDKARRKHRIRPHRGSKPTVFAELKKRLPIIDEWR